MFHNVAQTDKLIPCEFGNMGDFSEYCSRIVYVAVVFKSFGKRIIGSW